MPRDMSSTGRYAPQPRHQPIAFYSAVRLGDPEALARIMQVCVTVGCGGGGGGPGPGLRLPSLVAVR